MMATTKSLVAAETVAVREDRMKQFFVLAFGMTYACFSIMAIGKVFGFTATVVAILASAIAIAIVNDCVKERPW